MALPREVPVARQCQKSMRIASMMSLPRSLCGDGVEVAPLLSIGDVVVTCSSIGLLHVTTVVNDDTGADELAETQLMVISAYLSSSPVICSQKVPVQNDGNQCHKEVLEALL